MVLERLIGLWAYKLILDYECNKPVNLKHAMVLERLIGLWAYRLILDYECNKPLSSKKMSEIQNAFLFLTGLLFKNKPISLF